MTDALKIQVVAMPARDDSVPFMLVFSGNTEALQTVSLDILKHTVGAEAILVVDGEVEAESFTISDEDAETLRRRLINAG